MATVFTLQSRSQSDIAIKSQVMVPNIRTGSCDAPGGTATACILSPMSIPAAWRLMIESALATFACFCFRSTDFFTFAIRIILISKSFFARLQKLGLLFYTASNGLSENLKMHLEPD